MLVLGQDRQRGVRERSGEDNFGQVLESCQITDGFRFNYICTIRHLQPQTKADQAESVADCLKESQSPCSYANRSMNKMNFVIPLSIHVTRHVLD